MSDRRLRRADSAAFLRAMPAFYSGVAIACGEGEARGGFTIASLASFSLAPPTLFRTALRHERSIRFTLAR